jgi:hypothetical protein
MAPEPFWANPRVMPSRYNVSLLLTNQTMDILARPIATPPAYFIKVHVVLSANVA